MIIALCCRKEDAGAESELDERFGRCGYFLIYNRESHSYRSVRNSASDAAGGAGVKAVQLIADQGASVLLAPEVGPQGLEALKSMGIKVFRQGGHRTAGAALEAWQKEELEPLEKIQGLTKV